MTETLCPSLLRLKPQLAPLDTLTHATETAIIALCASHPRVEHELDDTALPGDITADKVIDCAMALLEAVDRYRLLLHDPVPSAIRLPTSTFFDPTTPSPAPRSRGRCPFVPSTAVRATVRAPRCPSTSSRD